MSATFIAQYPGVCGLCGDRIQPGQECTYAAFDEVIHTTCRDPLAPARATCPTCFVELPATGVCDDCA